MTNSRSITLILVSLAFLAVFELLWLRQAWREQLDSLQQETDYIFQQTVTALQDSLLRQTMRQQELAPDSISGFKIRSPRQRASENLNLSTSDTAPPRLESQTRVLLRMDADSGQDLQQEQKEFSQFQVIVIRSDSSPAKSGNSGGGLDRLLLNIPDAIDPT